MQMHDHQCIKNRGVWTSCFQTYTQLPVGRRREVVGSTSAIRLQRPLIIIQDFPKKIKRQSSKITTLLKISETSNKIYDIIKPHWQIDWQCRGSGEYHSRRTTIIGFLRMPKPIIPKNKIKNHNFFHINPIFAPTPTNFAAVP